MLKITISDIFNYWNGFRCLGPAKYSVDKRDHDQMIGLSTHTYTTGR